MTDVAGSPARLLRGALEKILSLASRKHKDLKEFCKLATGRLSDERLRIGV
jgi:hypothetical protein